MTLGAVVQMIDGRGDQQRELLLLLLLALSFRLGAAHENRSYSARSSSCPCKCSVNCPNDALCTTIPEQTHTPCAPNTCSVRCPLQTNTSPPSTTHNTVVVPNAPVSNHVHQLSHEVGPIPRKIHSPLPSPAPPRVLHGLRHVRCIEHTVKGLAFGFWGLGLGPHS